MKKLMAMTLLAIICQFGGAHAQTQFATISGQVKDASGSVVPSATIKLLNSATGLGQTSTSNEAGIYAIPNVAAGDYELTVEQTGFHKYIRKLTITVAERAVVDIKLEVGSISETVYVKDQGATANIATGDLSTAMSEQDIQILPLLNRNPYNLISLVPGSSDAGATAGDSYGVGIAVSGARTRSINFMLDGAENNDNFMAGPGQSIPQDSIEEFRLQTNNMTAEFGRNLIVANVITKSGGNSYHGSAYEFYRGSGLSARNFDDNATGTPKGNFVRNQFGGSFGGPINKENTFFFGSFESTIVRSSASQHFYIPTQDFLNAAAPNTQAFIKGFGNVPAGDSNQVITAKQIVEDAEGGVYADSPLTNHNTGKALAASTPLFARYTMEAPVDAGGGNAQDTYMFTGRVDHKFSANTQLLARYAYDQSTYPIGSNSVSPWADFRTGVNERYQNYAFALTHNFSPKIFSETRVTYNRLNQNQPLGKAPVTTPCWTYDLQKSTPTGDSIVFPGYLPDSCSYASVPSGGPQNIYQAYHGMAYVHGIHTFKWGGQYIHIRDNETFGAPESGFYDTFTMQGMLDGLVDLMEVAIDPKGKFPGDKYTPAVDGPLGPPNFTRHYRYNEIAGYFEDSLKATSRLNLTLGLRWEYFGVLHSPGNEKSLDANLFFGAVGSANSSSIYEQIRDARFSRTSNLYNQDLANFAPRFGFAYDLTGKGRTVLRGGYGLFYDRNFGNALSNVVQNFPNFAIIVQIPAGSVGGTPVPIANNQFDSLNALMSGGSLSLSGSGRMLDKNMKTAYSAQWNVTLEHDILGKGIIGSLSYIGTNGYHLYSLNNLNSLGSCLLDPSINPTCNPGSTGSSSRLNQSGLTGMNRRGNEGLSRYHAMALEVRGPRMGSTGVNLKANYTWAHSIDNASSFFGDSNFEGLFGFGFRDPFNPAFDRASSTNDVRHRVNIYGSWTPPFAKSMTGAGAKLLRGWALSGIFSAQTGTAFSVYDGSTNSQCNNNGTNFCYPVIIGNAPQMTEKTAASPNTFVLYDNLNKVFKTQQAYCNGDMACTARLYTLQASLLSPRNLFRTPGIWHFDTAVVKEFPLPKEGIKLRFNADFLDVFNHANLYAYPGTNVYSGAGSQVVGRRGIDASGGKEQRNVQLALRLIF